MSNQFIVSVIVPSYNYAHFLPDTLRSIQAQSCDNWECIIIDDGSTDNTREVAEDFALKDPRIKYIHQMNQGLSSARNTGIAHSTGKYVQLLDADDLIQTRKLEAQSAFLEDNPLVDVIYGAARLFTTEDMIERLNDPWVPYDPGIEYDLTGQGSDLVMKMLRTNMMFVNTALQRRDVINEIGQFDEKLKSVEDWDYWLRCALAGKRFALFDAKDAIAMVRFHAGSMIKNKRSMYTGTLLLRHKLNGVLTDEKALAINREQMREEQVALWIQEGLAGDMARSIRKIILTALKHGNFRWFSYALALPLAKSSKGRALVLKLRPFLDPKFR